jgi:recombinational DNA repair protein RecT
MSKNLSDILTAKSFKDLLDLEIVREQVINQYTRVHNKDGAYWFDSEKLFFLSKLEDAPKLKECTNFSLYSAFMRMATLGVYPSLDEAYFEPTKSKVIKDTLSWKGKQRIMSELPNVVMIYEPQLVYDCDEFDFENAPNLTIVKHKKPREKPANAQLQFVWMRVDYIGGTQFYMMDIEAVHKAREYSSSWKFNKANSMWTTSTESAWKKTLVNYLWAKMPKSNKMKFAQKANDEMEKYLQSQNDEPIDDDPFADVPTGYDSESGEIFNQ